MKFLLFSGLICFISACSGKAVFDSNNHFDNQIWKIKDTAIFNVSVTDTMTPCNFYVNIRVSKTYKYSNLWVFFYTENPRGQTEKDTLEFILADPTGRWLGKGVGDVLEYDIMFRYKAIFPESGTYRFALEQGMRNVDLSGIADVGLRITKSEQE